MLESMDKYIGRERFLNQVIEFFFFKSTVFGVSIALLFLCLVYLPSHPPTPPSITATSDRLDFKKGILSLIRYDYNKHSLCFIRESLGNVQNIASSLRLFLECYSSSLFAKS